MNDGPISPTQYICRRMNFTGKRLSKSIMCHNRLDSCQEDKKTQSERNNIPWSSPRMKCYCIHSSLSQYKVLSPFFSFLLSLLDYMPHFSWRPFPYIVLLFSITAFYLSIMKVISWMLVPSESSWKLYE